MTRVLSEDDIQRGVAAGELSSELLIVGNDQGAADPAQAIASTLEGLTTEVAQIRATMEARPQANNDKLALELARLTGVIATNLAAVLEILKRPAPQVKRTYRFTWIDANGKTRTMTAEQQ